MAAVDDVEQYLALGHETRAFEVKGPGDLGDRRYCARVARAAMAMGNLQDGGVVCLGIAENALIEMLPGLSEAQAEAWSNFDNVADAVARFCDPPVNFRLVPLTLSSNARVVLLDVQEFEAVPHVCSRDYPDVTQAGALYVRTRGKPQSSHVKTASELRELLDLATTKGVREFIRRASIVGLLPTTVSAAELPTAAFAAERDETWSHPSPLDQKIHTSGRFDVAIRPLPHDSRRISPADLQETITNNTVRLRGWPVPYVDHRTQVRRHPTWIGQDLDSTVVPHAEAWRFSTSGQFLHRRILATDLSDAPVLHSRSPGATGTVAVWDVLLYLVELAELAARLATAVSAEAIEFDVSIRGISGRDFISGDWGRELHGHYRVDSDEVRTNRTTETFDLLRDPPSVGIELTQDLLGQAGIKLPEEILRDWQDQVFRR